VPSGLLTCFPRSLADRTISVDMRFRITHLLVTLLTVNILFVPALAADSDPVLMVVGDSISAGYKLDLEVSWTSLLQTRLKREGYGYRLVNASISGDTSGNGLRRLPRALRIHQPDIVILELGGNDGLRGLPIEVIRDNLAQMIALAQEANAQVVLAGMLMPPNYGDEYTAAFASLYIALAAQYEVPLVPFFMKNVALDPSKMQADGIHPNEAAQPILMDNVWEFLQPLLTPAASGNAALSAS
jgi:acyl-CoA thioesterase-1